MNILRQVLFAIFLVCFLNTLFAWVEGRFRQRSKRQRQVPERERLVPEKDWGALMQKAAEDHLEQVNDALWLEEEAGAIDVESPAAAPFCGCGTCVVREVLVGAWPVIAEMIAAASSSDELTLRLTSGDHVD